MEGFGPATYGDRFADVYDDWYRDLGPLGPCLDRLEALADGRPVLELGVGTGRVAIPLARRGVSVVGLDASAAMLRRLTAAVASSATKGAGPTPGPTSPDPASPAAATPVRAVRADAAAPPFAPGSFGLVFAAYNTFWSIGDVRRQADCLGALSRCLVPGGHVVLEGMAAPSDPQRPSSVVEVSRLDADAVVLLASQEHRDDQRLEGQHIHITEAGIRLRPWSIHYLDRDQLDGLATAAGLEPVARWGSWDATAATDDDAVLITVLRRPHDGPGTGR